MLNPQHLISLIDNCSVILGRSIAWLTLLMAGATLLVVVLRYGFNLGSIALQESVTYMHAMVFLLGTAFTFKQDRHVRVDVFYRIFSTRTRAWINSVCAIIFLLPFCSFIFFTSVDYVVQAWKIKETSPEPGGLPYVYLLKTLIPIMAFTLFLQGGAACLRNAMVLLQAEGKHD